MQTGGGDTHSWLDKFISKPPHYNSTNNETTPSFSSVFLPLSSFSLYNFCSVLVSAVSGKVGILSYFCTYDLITLNSKFKNA